jgi:heat shock protein HslJ
MRTRTSLTIAVVILALSSAGVFGIDLGVVFVTESDLRHHRWVLESVNGESLPADAADGMIPELDFGEQRHVEGNTGCNRFSGRAILRDEHAVLNVLHQESMISLEDDNGLTLEAGSVVLRFRLRDWVD